MFKNHHLKFVYFLYLFLFLIIVFLVFIFFQKPSLDRNWSLDQKILAQSSFSGNIVSIKNIRDFSYETSDKYEVSYYDKSYNLDEISSVYYIIEPFSDYDGPAHTMLTFGFSNGDYLTISAEIRKEVGESFSAFWGILNKYEMVYIIGDENDLIKLRANYRKDDVIMYPVNTSKEKMKTLFVSMLERANKLAEKPEFYNTITNNCTTSILQHVNILRQGNNENQISWSKEALLPSHSDKIAYDLGLINTKLSLEEAREYYKINELSEKYGNDEKYSELIRKEKK
ncbi:MAG: DUF4105 domain-containing protein [Candidatus Gracilibacteria bacterium]|nr:DUF4105 domain-containing protein [Candidatus Gracilibacteria bacterium]